MNHKTLLHKIRSFSLVRKNDWLIKFSIIDGNILLILFSVRDHTTIIKYVTTEQKAIDILNDFLHLS